MAVSKMTTYWHFVHVLEFRARVTIFCDWVDSESVGLWESGWQSLFSLSIPKISCRSSNISPINLGYILIILEDDTIIELISTLDRSICTQYYFHIILPSQSNIFSSFICINIIIFVQLTILIQLEHLLTIIQYQFFRIRDKKIW